MNVAVIQHRMRGSLEEDIEALAASIRDACQRGARIVICPAVPSITADADTARPAILGKLEGCEEGTALLIPFRDTADADAPTIHETPFGATALLLGDEALRESFVDRLAASPPDAIVIRALAESELQAEAIVEHAIGLSLSVSGAVFVAECSGAEFAEPGHGGSAIIVLGEIVSEAVGDEDVLIADVAVPVPAPEPREELPTLPPILEQRVAHHEGRKPDVGYLADLS